MVFPFTFPFNIYLRTDNLIQLGARFHVPNIFFRSVKSLLKMLSSILFVNANNNKNKKKAQIKTRRV